MSGSDRRAIHWSRIFNEHHSVSVVYPAFAKGRFSPPVKAIHLIEREEPVGLVNYLKRTFDGVLFSFRERTAPYSIVYSSSDLLPDAIPALVLRLLNRRVRWITGMHLIAPNPINGYDGVYTKAVSKRSGVMNLKLWYYFCTQRFVIFFAKRLAELIFVSNDDDRATLCAAGISPDKIMVTYGAPEWDLVAASETMEPQRFDCCFVARFHPQKGYDDMIKAWALVVKAIPGARLAILGNIPKERLAQLMAENNIPDESIEYLGFVDGGEKYKYLRDSRILAFPSTYESFGMVAAEGQACGLPVVAYDLPFFEKVYPKGMVRAPIGDYGAFANLVIDLLSDPTKLKKIGADATENAKAFDFSLTAQRILTRLEGQN